MLRLYIFCLHIKLIAAIEWKSVVINKSLILHGDTILDAGIRYDSKETALIWKIEPC